MADEKFSQFTAGGDIQDGDIVVGLRGGSNTKFDAPVPIPELGQGDLLGGVEGSDPVAINLISKNNSIKVDKSVDGEINVETTGGPGGGSLQSAYDNGTTIELDEDRPFQVFTQGSSPLTESVVTPSSGSSHIAQYVNKGWTFTPSVNISILSFQYPDFRYTDSNSRVVGIFINSTQQELLEWPVNPTDPLVSGYRTATLPYPLNLQGGVEYVIAVTIPPNENYGLNNDAVPASEITVSGYNTGTPSNTLIPLSFPQTFTASPNITPAGFFQYEIIIPAANAQYNSGLDGDAAFYKVESTTMAAVPIPAMTENEANVIPDPYDGLQAWNTDVKSPYVRSDGQWKYIIPMGRNFPTGPTNPVKPDNEYICQDSLLATLQMPTTAYVGSQIKIIAPGAGGFKAKLNTGQFIKFYFSNTYSSTASGGYVTNIIPPGFPNSGVEQGTEVVLECIVEDTTWLVVTIIGNLLFQ